MCPGLQTLINQGGRIARTAYRSGSCLATCQAAFSRLSSLLPSLPSGSQVAGDALVMQFLVHSSHLRLIFPRQRSSAVPTIYFF